MKLYPPLIEGKLPACAGNSLTVPFAMNKAVSETQVGNIMAIIKNISTGTIVTTLSYGTLVKNNKGYSASFDNEKENGAIAKLTNGQYYKIQLAYVDRDGVVGYYSPVGTFKRTTTPRVTIPALEGNFFSGYEYTGLYSQEGQDETEKIYSYQFELTDMDGNIIDFSGELVHNSENDNSTSQSEDTWKSNIELKKDTPYYLVYKVTTMNGLECTSPRYVTMNQDSIDIDLDIELQTNMDIDNGCIELSIAPKINKSVVVSGSFALMRTSSKSNFSSWDEVYKFSYLNTMISKDAPKKFWEDCTVEQGEEYLYAIQAFNSRNLYSNRLESRQGKIKVDFVDAFLSDGNRQLRIQFNPKVSSFKNTILETKTDTIGSQYPFIFRNGYVNYKEFQISGLISLLSDDAGKFMSCKTCKYKDACALSSKNIRCSKYEPTQDNSSRRLISPSVQGTEVADGFRNNLSADNIYNERQFKLEVLNWLNNGSPKIFRSPTEGNYIIRTMNVSLSPLDGLGRMLHSFQCTAYEIAEWNFKNLLDLKLIELPSDQKSNLKIAQISPIEMIHLYKESPDEFQNQYFMFDLFNDISISFGKEAFSLNVTEATPGTVLQFTFSNGNVPIIEIGGTGGYYVQTREYGVTGVQLISGSWNDLKITFEYYDDSPTDAFSNIANLTLTDEIRRFVGPGYKLNIPAESAVANDNHIVSDIRREVGNFHYIKVEKRYIQEVWPITVDGITRWARNGVNDFINANEWNPVVIYYNHANKTYYNGNMDTPMIGEPDYRFRLNSSNENIYTDLGPRAMKESNGNSKFGNTFGRIDAIYNVGHVDYLQIGNGLIADVAYRVRTKEYVVESEDPETIATKRIWEQARKEIDSAIKNRQPTSYIENCIKTANLKYNDFIIKLKAALKRKGVLV